MQRALKKWIAEVDAYMLKHYCITMTEDAGVSREELANAMLDGRTPQEHCEWFAEKYDLTSRREMRANWGIAD